MSLAARLGDAVGSHGGAAPFAAVARSATAGAGIGYGDSATAIASALGAGNGGAPCSTIAAGAGTVFIEGKAVARAGDAVPHGAATLKEGSATVIVNGRPVSREGDASTCGGRVVAHAKYTVIGGPSSANAAPAGAREDVSSNVAAMLAGMDRAERDMAAARNAGETGVQIADASPAGMSASARARMLAARTAAADDALQSARAGVGTAMTERAAAMQAMRDAAKNGGDVSAARARVDQASASFARATALTRVSADAEDDAVRDEVAGREREVYGPNGPTAMQRVQSGAAFTGSFVGSAIVNAPSAVVDSGVGLATGAWQIVRHPIDTAHSVASAFTTPADPVADAKAQDARERQSLAQSRGDRLQMVEDPSGAGTSLGKMVDDVIVGPMILGGILGKVGGALLGRIAKRGGAAADAAAAATPIEAEACPTCAARNGAVNPAPPPEPPPPDPPPPKELMTDAERMARAKELFPGLQGHGTCSLMSCAQIIEQATTVRLGEQEMMNLGERVGAYDRSIDGTHGDRIPDVLREAGVPAHLEEPTMDNVQNALAQGKGVITSHDIETFGGHPVPDDGGTHSVMPVAVMRNGSGGMTSVRLNDTGNGALLTGKSPTAFSNSLTGLVVTDNPIWVK